MMKAYLLHIQPTVMSQVASAQAVTCSDLFRLQLCAGHDYCISIHRDVFIFRTIFTSMVFVYFLFSFFPSSVLSAFLSVFPHLFFFDIFRSPLPFCTFYIFPSFFLPLRLSSAPLLVLFPVHITVAEGTHACQCLLCHAIKYQSRTFIVALCKQ